MGTFFSCKDCENREIGCHVTCEKYQAECQEFDKAKAYIHKDDDYIDYMHSNMPRKRRR